VTRTKSGEYHLDVYAAVVRSFGSPPRYGPFDLPAPSGSDQEAVSARAYLAELPSLIDEIEGGGIAVTARPVPLAEVATAWTAPEVPGVRTVLVP
jgi:hypothetical protein